MTIGKILIVEDHPATQAMLTEVLQGEGYDVLTAQNGVKLIKTVREQRPDLVLMDVIMPFVDGYDLTKAIRETEEIGEIPVFIVSAKATRHDIERGFESGATEYIEKPFDIGDLLCKIELALDSYRRKPKY